MNPKIQKTKETLSKLANDANLEMSQNKILSQQIKSYEEQINKLKNMLSKYSIKSLKENENSMINELFSDVKNYRDSLQAIKKTLNSDLIKINLKKDQYCFKLFDANSIQNQMLEQKATDNFILFNTILEKENEIIKYKQLVKSAKDYSLFREPKRETFTQQKYGTYFLDNQTQELQQNMLYECRQYNRTRTKCEKRCLKKMKLQEEKNFYKSIIADYNNQQKMQSMEVKLDDKNYADKINKIPTKTRSMAMNVPIFSKINPKNNHKNMIGLRGKAYMADDDQKIDYNNNKSYFGKKSLIVNERLKTEGNLLNKTVEFKNKNSKAKFRFLTLEELFDASNDEKENGAIIDEELHSDDEVVFEIKIKGKKKVTVHYLKQLKKQVPPLNLSQIEFNKIKVLNEADLYSMQKRKFQMQNLDENIRTMKIKIKKIKKRFRLNQKKEKSFEHFLKTMRNNFKELRKIKKNSSLANEKLDFISRADFEKLDKLDKMASDAMQNSIIEEDNNDEEEIEKDDDDDIINNIKEDNEIGDFEENYDSNKIYALGHEMTKSSKRNKTSRKKIKKKKHREKYKASKTNETQAKSA